MTIILLSLHLLAAVPKPDWDQIDYQYRVEIIRVCPEGYRAVIRPSSFPTAGVGVWLTLNVECDAVRPR